MGAGSGEGDLENYLQECGQLEIQITGQNLNITPAIRGRIERKLSKLNRHLPNITLCKVELAGKETKSPQQRFVAQITLDVNGILLRGEDRGDTLFAVVDKVIAVIDRQIERYKGRHYNKGRGSSFTRGTSDELIEDASLTNRIVKVKRFSVQMMSIPDAIVQMELLGHDFFLFQNAETQDINLLYRRRDGNYSIIEPEPN